MSLNSTGRRQLAKLCREAARAAFPRLYLLLSSYRFQAHCRRRYGKFQRHIRPLLYGSAAPMVLSGPFQGLRYLDETGLWGPIFPKWLGSYEDELHPFFERTLQSPPSVIVDVGAAEGYYAVLLAKRLPGTTVHSFDINPLAMRAQARLARLHQVSNLRISSTCTYESLGRLLGGSACGERLVICDIEGEEATLMDPQKCPELAAAMILVELHETMEFPGNDTRRLLESRFRDTHEIEFVPHAVKSIARYHEVTGGKLSKEELAMALNEVRGSSRGYLIMHPCAHPTAGDRGEGS